MPSRLQIYHWLHPQETPILSVINELGDRITDNEIAITAATDDIATNAGALTALDGRVDALENP